MHKSLALLLFVPMLLIAQKDYPVPQPSEPPDQTAPQQEKELSAKMGEQLKQGIKHVLISQVEAWNHGNLENFMEGYWRSPDLTFFSGATVTKGWEPTLARYQQRYKSRRVWFSTMKPRERISLKRAPC